MSEKEIYIPPVHHSRPLEHWTKDVMMFTDLLNKIKGKPKISPQEYAQIALWIGYFVIRKFFIRTENRDGLEQDDSRLSEINIDALKRSIDVIMQSKDSDNKEKIDGVYAVLLKKMRSIVRDRLIASFEAQSGSTALLALQKREESPNEPSRISESMLENILCETLMASAEAIFAPLRIDTPAKKGMPFYFSPDFMAHLRTVTRHIIVPEMLKEASFKNEFYGAVITLQSSEERQNQIKYQINQAREMMEYMWQQYQQNSKLAASFEKECRLEIKTARQRVAEILRGSELQAVTEKYHAIIERLWRDYFSEIEVEKEPRQKNSQGKETEEHRAWREKKRRAGLAEKARDSMQPTPDGTHPPLGAADFAFLIQTLSSLDAIDAVNEITTIKSSLELKAYRNTSSLEKGIENLAKKYRLPALAAVIQLFLYFSDALEKSGMQGLVDPAFVRQKKSPILTHYLSPPAPTHSPVAQPMPPGAS